MKLSSTSLPFLSTGLLAALLAAPLVAQTQIGGNTCNSSNLNGSYALSLTGREVNASGSFLGVLQANGTATFDGLSVVTIALSENTNQAIAAAPLNWSGTYSVEANCVTAITITSGGSATFNLMIFNQGKDFQMAGSDATYSYTGNGITQSSTQAAGCSASTLSGVYTFNAEGFALTTNAVSGVEDGTGLLQFDGQGNLTVTGSTTTGGGTVSTTTLTGSYSISSNCTGSATLTDAGSNTYAMSFSIYSVAATNTNFYASLARSGTFLMTGVGHTAYAEPTAGTCSTSSLNGTYSLSVSGRAISGAGIFAGSYQGIGTATFDGNGNVTLTGTDNSNVAQGSSFTFKGTYTLPSNCSGTLTVTTIGTATFSLVVWSSGAQFDLTGSDGIYVYAASGDNVAPPACATPTLSGEYTYLASGFLESGSTQNGAQDEAGILQFDGQGNVTTSYTDTQGGVMPVSDTGTGNYTVSGCSASATLKDPSGNSTTLNFVIEGAFGQTLDLLAASSQYVRTGTAHSAFLNPAQSITNVDSYAYNATPPGSIFALFGVDLATDQSQAQTVPLPTKLLTTTLTINGEKAPLFYVSTGQIDAQMPLDIQGNTVASVIVTNGTSVSNAAAVYVPATGTPGIGFYSTDHAVVINADGNLNSASDQAAVDDVVVAYFTGGGPVTASGPLATGAASPGGKSPVTGDNSVTVGGVQAVVQYMGLSPGSVGLYQANFVVPQLDKGSYPLVITIAGQESNNPVMNVSN